VYSKVRGGRGEDFSRNLSINDLFTSQDKLKVIIDLKWCRGKILSVVASFENGKSLAM